MPSSTARSATLTWQNWQAALVWCGLLFVALVFFPILQFDFVNWDDEIHVLRNPAVVGGGTARDWLLTPGLGYPIPVTVVTYAIEHLFFRLAPWPYHLTNLLLHLACCALVFRLARKSGLSRPAALVALLLFGVHPVVAEPVAWISGRKDLLATCLALWATSVFVTSVRSVNPWRGRLLATLLFALSALSKPSVLALPIFWLILEVRLRAASWRSSCVALAPAACVTLFVAILAMLGQTQIGAVDGREGFVWLRMVWYALGYHLGLLFFLQTPLAKHIPATVPPAFEPSVDLIPILFLLIVGLFARVRKTGMERERVWAGLVWAGLAYIPNSNLLPLNRLLADSYLYLPLVGMAIVCASGIEFVIPRMRRQTMILLGVAVGTASLAGLWVATTQAIHPWRDGVSLWTRVDATYPDSPQVCRNLGNAYFSRNDLPRALERFELCMRRFGPEHFEKNIAITLYGLHRTTEAAAIFQRLSTRFPDDPVIQKYRHLLESHR